MIDNLSRGFQVPEEGVLEGGPLVPESPIATCWLWKNRMKRHGDETAGQP